MLGSAVAVSAAGGSLMSSLAGELALAGEFSLAGERFLTGNPSLGGVVAADGSEEQRREKNQSKIQEKKIKRRRT